MNRYDISVKANTECVEPVAVYIISGNTIPTHTLDYLKNQKLDDARKYCQNVLKAKLIVK